MTITVSYIVLSVLIVISFLLSNFLVLEEEEGGTAVYISPRKNYTSIIQPLVYLLVLAVTLLVLHDQSLTIKIVAVLMLVSTMYDIKFLIAPDFINVAILLTGLMSLFIDTMSLQLIFEHALHAMIIGVACIVFNYAVPSKAIGGGDIKLFIAMAFVLVPDLFYAFLIIYCFLPVIVLLPYCFIRGKSIVTFSFPAVPFLTLAFIITVLYGQTLISFYQGGFQL